MTGLYIEMLYDERWFRLELGGPYATLADAEDTIAALMRVGLEHRYRVVDVAKVDGHVVVSVRKEIEPT